MKNYELNLSATSENCAALISEIVADFSSEVTGAKVHTRNAVTGIIRRAYGANMENILVEIEFPTETKKFGLGVALSSKFLSFENPELAQVYVEYANVCKDILAKQAAYEAEAKQAKLSEAKEREAMLRAEASYERSKERAIQSFEEMTKQTKNISAYSNEYFYVIGWLAKHIGTISATIPEYLNSAFIKHFGADAVHNVVDSKKKTSGGYAMQWSWSFKASLPKVSDVPCMLVPYMNESQTQISSTSFIWDLINNHGFKFGRKQDLDAIRASVPDVYSEEFYMGYNS